MITFFLVAAISHIVGIISYIYKIGLSIELVTLLFVFVPSVDSTSVADVTMDVDRSF
jgi:hypothetical protein